MERPAGGEDQVEGLDEEFLFHLARGSDGLARGDAEAARAALARALELRPRDTKVLGLLGQACYRLGRFDDATAAWQRLVDESPVEPAGRVNLGLALLRARRYPEAAKQLEIALDLNPDHKKAMGYLGLALLESGEPARAREWFHKAGSEQMVARCDEVLAAPSTPTTAAEEGQEAEEEGQGAAPAPGMGPLSAREPGPLPAPESSPVPEPSLASGPESSAAPEPGPSLPSESLQAPGPNALAAAPPAAPAPGLASSAAAWLLPPPEGRVFTRTGSLLAVRVRGEVRIRLDGLLATQGRIEVTPEVKRFRGQATGTPFGAGTARMHRARGEGLLLLAAGGRRRLTAVVVGAEGAYLREEAVFGFEEAVAFENGRVPSQGEGELHLVHLRGRGEVLLVTVGEPLALDVTPQAPLRLPLAALVGWLGAVTPRTTALIESAPTELAPAVELTGEGRVIVDPAAVGQADGAAP